MPIEMGTKITFFPAMSLAGSARTPAASARQAPSASPVSVPRSVLPPLCNISFLPRSHSFSQISDGVGLRVSRVEIVVDENRRHQDDAFQHVLGLRAEVVERHAVAKNRNQRGADQEIADASASASERDTAEHD